MLPAVSIPTKSTITFAEAFERYKVLGKKIGDVIPSDKSLAKTWHIPIEWLYDIRQQLRPIGYQYAHELESEQWKVVFIPHRKDGAKIVAAYVKDLTVAAEHALQKFEIDLNEYMANAVITDMTSYNVAKRDGRVYAFTHQAELTAAHKAYSLWFTTNVRRSMPVKVERTPLEELGLRVNILLMNVCKKYHPHKHIIFPKFINSANTEVSEAHGKRVKLDIRRLYYNWCNNHKFVPKDEVLAHFTGLSLSAFTKYRNTLRSEGYGFTSVKNGWEIELPETMTPEEAAELARLLDKQKRIEGRKSDA